jgi:hypothetical protein
MFRDFENNMKFDQVLDPDMAADANGSSVDLLGYEGVTFLALVGESGDTLGAGVYIELEVEDSADNSTFADCADTVITNAVTGNNTGTFAKIDAAAEDDAVYATTYSGSARYVRPVVNITGTHTNGTPLGIVAVRFGADRKPVSN